MGLEQTIVKLKKDWEKYLKRDGVKFPSGKTLNKLVCLYLHMPNPMTLDQMFEWHQKNGLPTFDRQPRHLADQGWYIKSGNKRFTRSKYESEFKSNQNSLHTIKKPNPLWSKDDKKRIKNLSNLEWLEILKLFKKRGCAVCGRKMKHYDKGHLLKSKSEEKGNIVPMCSECNNWGLDVEFKMYGLIARPIIKKK